MPLTLRYLHMDDVDQVVTLDEQSFPDPWTNRSYLFEINQSNISFMCVLVNSEAALPPPSTSWWQRLLGRRSPAYEAQVMVVAYGGLWCITEEAHVSTIASHPQFRGHGYGEIALVGMLLRALELDATYTVLEVRVSNLVGQALYHKYGFVTTDTNRKYYRDGEDAFAMRLDFTPDAIARVRALYEQLQERTPFDNQFSFILHPRLQR